jgi:hypothetical protein
LGKFLIAPLNLCFRGSKHISVRPAEPVIQLLIYYETSMEEYMKIAEENVKTNKLK